MFFAIDHIEMIGGGITKRHISSASSALIIGGALGLIQAVILICTAKPLLSYMGVKQVSFLLVSFILFFSDGNHILALWSHS